MPSWAAATTDIAANSRVEITFRAENRMLLKRPPESLQKKHTILTGVTKNGGIPDFVWGFPQTKNRVLDFAKRGAGKRRPWSRVRPPR